VVHLKPVPLAQRLAIAFICSGFFFVPQIFHGVQTAVTASQTPWYSTAASAGVLVSPMLPLLAWAICLYVEWQEKSTNSVLIAVHSASMGGTVWAFLLWLASHSQALANAPH
jgi:hypothetical protein